MGISKIITLSLVIVVLLSGWFLFRPSTDELHLDDPRIGTVLTFDVPMIYITNCSQCSFSPRAQNVNIFLEPQTSLYDITGFLDEDSVISRVGTGNRFTVQEVVTNHPHGLETAFRGDHEYVVVTDQEGVESVLSSYSASYAGLNEKEFETSYNNNPEIKDKLRLIDDAESMGVYWVIVELNPHPLGYYSETYLPDNLVERKIAVATIQDEFLNEFPKDQVLQYKSDPLYPRVYLQLDKTNALLYMQAEWPGLNIKSLVLYQGEGDPSVIR